MRVTRNASKPRLVLLLTVVVVLAAALAVSLMAGQRRARRQIAQTAQLEAELPRLSRSSNYLSSARCQACHPGEYASWMRTFHRTMTQVASPERVAGKFDGTTVDSAGLKYRVYQDQGRLLADLPDPDELMYVVQGGKKLALTDIPRVTRPVVMATGSHHYQTYWVSSPRYPRLMQTLPLVYLLEDQRWIPREAAFMRGPEDTERFVTQWNHHCIRCHSTGGNPGLEEGQGGRLFSEVGELGIACEACHGSGEEHVRKYTGDPLARYAAHSRGGGSNPTNSHIVNPARLDHQLSSDVCGLCHGVHRLLDKYGLEFARHGPLFEPGEPLSLRRHLIRFPRAGSPPDEWEELKKNQEFFRERWWEDGTILAGGREHAGMTASACFQKGTMSCLSCHSMHGSDPNDQLKAGMDGNAACTQCHREARFGSELAKHTFHRAGSSGSECQNCHMPHTTYALFTAIRSHQIESPQIRSGARHGVPNACNLCHLDQTLAWTGEHLSRWYGQPTVALSQEQRETSAALLWLLKGHAAQRAITAWHLGWAPAQAVSGADWIAPFDAELLKDPYGVVRYVAAKSLRSLPGFADFPFDFLAAPAALTNATLEVQRRWREQTSKPSRTGTAVMLQADGAVEREAVAWLERNRNNRSVTISE